MSEERLDWVFRVTLVLCLVWFVVQLLYGVFAKESLLNQEVMGIFESPPAEGSYRTGMLYTLPLGVIACIITLDAAYQEERDLFVELIGGLLLGGAITFLGVYPIIVSFSLLLFPVVALIEGKIFWAIVGFVLLVYLVGVQVIGRLVWDALF